MVSPLSTPLCFRKKKKKYDLTSFQLCAQLHPEGAERLCTYQSQMKSGWRHQWGQRGKCTTCQLVSNGNLLFHKHPYFHHASHSMHHETIRCWRNARYPIVCETRGGRLKGLKSTRYICCHSDRTWVMHFHFLKAFFQDFHFNRVGFATCTKFGKLLNRTVIIWTGGKKVFILLPWPSSHKGCKNVHKIARVVQVHISLKYVSDYFFIYFIKQNLWSLINLHSTLLTLEVLEVLSGKTAVDCLSCTFLWLMRLTCEVKLKPVCVKKLVSILLRSWGKEITFSRVVHNIYKSPIWIVTMCPDKFRMKKDRGRIVYGSV